MTTVRKPKAAIVDSPKITRPRLHRVVSRDRLFDKIADAGSPIIWVSGPPGAGKTTLAASYLQSRKLPAIWYQTDGGDTDPATFFYYMGLAAAQCLPGRHRSLPLLPAESRVDLSTFTRRYFRMLFESFPRSGVLVVDNYQDAAGSFFDFMWREALAEVPDGVTVIVLSLSDPPATLARLVANRSIAMIDADELRFTQNESKQVVLMQMPLDADMLKILHERSGGWAAGLVLMTEHLRRRGPNMTATLVETQEMVFDYFAGEIFSRTSPENQRILMLTAVLPRITPRVAEATCGNRGADKLLDYLYRRHLFTDRRHGAEIVYQYHALFRAFLRARAAALLAPDERKEAAGRAARVLEADGQTEDSVSMYLESLDWPAATRLILQHARHLYEQGRWRTLLEWIATMPSTVVDGVPSLAYWVGSCQVWTSPVIARQQLEKAFVLFVGASDRTGQVLTAGAMSRACILDTSWTALDKWIGILEHLLSGDHAALSPQTRLTGFSRLLYATFVRQPLHPRLPEWANEVQAALGSQVDCNEVVLAGFSLMMYYNSTGDTSNQEHLVRQLHPILANPRVGPVSLAYWKWGYSSHLLRTGRPREALAIIDEGLELAEGNGLAIGGVIRRYRIGHLLTLCDLANAESEIRKLESVPQVEPYYEMKSWLSLMRGNLAQAHAEAQAAMQMATARGRTYYQILDLFLLAEVLLEAGDFEEAQVHIDAYRRHTAGMVGQLATYQALLLEAYSALLQRDRPTCHARMRSALAIGRQQRYSTHWTWFPAMMVRLYEEALDQGMEVAYVCDVIRQHGILPQSTDVENWPWPVKIYTLGRFEVFNDGELLRFEGKAQRKPIELAKMLVALGGRDVSTKKLIDLLWPNPAAGDGQKAFDITVHRLRKLLGRDEAVLVTARSVSFNAQLVWVDAWALEHRLATLVASANAEPPAIGILEAEASRILHLYQGHFLAGEMEEPWHLSLKNRLSGRFQRFVLRLGQDWESRQLWQRAGELYQRAIELDPLAENFYTRQMCCLQALGQRAEALEVFRRCRHTLSVMLGVRPTDEIEVLYRRLLGPQ